MGCQEGPLSPRPFREQPTPCSDTHTCDYSTLLTQPSVQSQTPAGLLGTAGAAVEKAQSPLGLTLLRWWGSRAGILSQGTAKLRLWGGNSWPQAGGGVRQQEQRHERNFQKPEVGRYAHALGRKRASGRGMATTTRAASSCVCRWRSDGTGPSLLLASCVQVRLHHRETEGTRAGFTGFSYSRAGKRAHCRHAVRGCEGLLAAGESESGRAGHRGRRAARSTPCLLTVYTRVYCHRKHHGPKTYTF